MKINFKKIATVIGSALMVGSTVGMAAAMSFPAPFVSSNGANVAIVVGSSSQVALSDAVAAANLGSVLASKLAANTATAGTASSATASGGDSYKLEKTSTKFHLGNSILDVVSGTVTSDNLPTLLGDGKYLDSNNDEFAYTQKIVLSNNTLGLFNDNDYAADTPSIGMRIPSGNNVLNYTLSFTDQPYWNHLTSTNLNLLGKTYFVLSTDTPTNTTLTLLDSAQTTTLNEGESKTLTVNGTTYNVSIGFIGSTQVELNVNGQTTNSLQEAQTQKLSDGAYVGIKNILVQDYAGGTKQVEFSIGSGKLKLVNNTNVQINDNTISRLTSTFTNSGGQLTGITLAWNADGDLFAAGNTSATMPGFNAVKLSFGGMSYPTTEAFNVEAGSDTYMTLKSFPLKDTTYDVNLVYTTDNANVTGIGKDANNMLRTSANGTLTYDQDTDAYFVASYNDTSNSESYLMKADNFKVVSGTNKTTIEYRNGDSWTAVKSDAAAGDSVSIGSVGLTVGSVDYNNRAVVLTAGTGVNFKTLYSATGLRVLLPVASLNTSSTPFVESGPNLNCTSVTWSPGVMGPVFVNNGTATTNGTCYSTTFDLQMTERDKSGNVGLGKTFNATLGFTSSTSNPQMEVTAVTGAGVYTDSTSTTVEQQGSSKIYEGDVYSALATQLLWDKSGNQYSLGVNYHGGESFGNLFLAAPSATVSTVTTGTTGSAQELGSVTVYDNEVSTVQAKNLIVVGGSCINTVAAKLLGSNTPVCGADFTAATGIADGQFLIQSFASPYTANNVALLVAGYNAADTTKAATYLANNAVTTDAGTKVKKTSVTFADVV